MSFEFHQFGHKKINKSLHISCFFLLINSLWFCRAEQISSNCGVRDIAATLLSSDARVKRILGGDEAIQGEFPWQVRLRSFGEVTYSGVLVGYNWVLTAASCFDGNYQPTLWNAVLGDYSKVDLDSRERTVFVDDIFIYGGFQAGHFKNNIALVKLRLDQVDELDIVYNPVCVANGTEDLTTSCYITGWGATQKDQGPDYSLQVASSKLQKLKVFLQSNSECSSSVADSVDVGPEYLCVIDDKLNRGPCTGDRGSPVLCQSGNKWSVVGVVSEEYACPSHQEANQGKVVNIAHYTQWINKIISKF